MFFCGTPWQVATRDDPNYAHFLVGWDKFLKENPDGAIDSINYPSCGKIFHVIPRPALRRLLLRMLHPDPAKRLTIHEVLNDRWLRNIECCCPDPKDSEISYYAGAIGMDGLQSMDKMSKPHKHCPPKKGLFDFDFNWHL